MNINKYTAFLKVVELGSITKASAVLGHTQSGVTQLLNSLEKELGVSLLTRSRQGIALTPEGEKLYPLIQDVVTSNEKLQNAALGLQSSEDNTIRIGTFTSVAVHWLPEIIREYQQIAPHIHFDLIDCGYNNIEETLTKQQMDFGFVPLPLSLKCRCISLYEDRLLAVLPPSHPAAGNATCSLELFRTEPVISLISSVDRDARSVFEKNGIQPNIKYTASSDYAMLAMVENSLGICIMPELILQGSTNQVKTLELDPPAFRTIGIAFPSSGTVKPSALHFSQFAAEWIQQHKQQTRR